MLLAVFATVLIIFLVTSLATIDKIYLFKLLRIDKAIEYLADLPEKLIAQAKQKKAEKQALLEGNKAEDPPPDAGT